MINALAWGIGIGLVLAVVIGALYLAGSRICPECRTLIPRMARVCPQCQRDIEPVDAKRPHPRRGGAARPGGG